MSNELVLHTFGDSVLDCGMYNAARITPAALILRNNNVALPLMKGQDLATMRWGTRVFLDHRATDGATADDLLAQTVDLDVDPDVEHIALVSIGGNDLLTHMNPLRGLDFDAALAIFDQQVEQFLAQVDMPTYLLNVYDPSFGDDTNNILGVPDYLLAAIAPEYRKRHVAVNNNLLLQAARSDATLIDMHKHFLAGESTWYTNVIEPSVQGASEIRRLFLDSYLWKVPA